MRSSKVLQDRPKTDAQRALAIYRAQTTAPGWGAVEPREFDMLVDPHITAPPSPARSRAASVPIRSVPIPSRGRLLVMAGALAVQFGVLLACATRHLALTLVGVLAVGLLLGVAANVDLLEHRIPNRLLSWSAIVVLAVTGLSGQQVLDDVALGTALAFIPIAVVLLTRGVGMGDVKMAGVLGAAGGLIHPLVGLATVFLMALSTGIVGLTTRYKRLALGPWLWAAFVVASSVAAVVLRLRAS